MRPFDHIDFKSLIAKETNGRMRVRLMALSHIKEVAMYSNHLSIKSKCGRSVMLNEPLKIIFIWVKGI
jgi:hypothetical protein